MHAQHDLSTKPAVDETSLEAGGDTSQADDVAVAPTTGQAASLFQGSISIGQLSPYIALSPGHVTTLFNPESGTEDASNRTERSGEAPVNQPVGAVRVQGVLTSVGTEALATPDAVANVSTDQSDNHQTNAVDQLLGGTPQTKLLLPQAAGLVANALPLDEAALEKAVDQFFEQLEELGVGQLVEQAPTHVIPLSLALLSTMTAAEVVRRRLRSRNGESKATERKNPLASEELLGFPELPGSWSTNLT